VLFSECLIAFYVLFFFDKKSTKKIKAGPRRIPPQDCFALNFVLGGNIFPRCVRLFFRPLLMFESFAISVSAFLTLAENAITLMEKFALVGPPPYAKPCLFYCAIWVIDCLQLLKPSFWLTVGEVFCI
jgi:hypothetical protein